MSGIDIIKKIGETPNCSYINTHYFCDYIELLALLENGDIVSTSDVYNRFLQDGKINEAGSDMGDEVNGNWESRIDEWFTFLEIRQTKFGKLYPFLVDRDRIHLCDNVDDKKITYTFLLLSSTRKYIKDNNMLSTDFEKISCEALKNYLPCFAKTFQFGKSNESYDRYKGHITEKIDDLARDLDCQTIYESRFFAHTDNGDGGLDVVAWVPFSEDSNKCNIQVYLGQCATGFNWRSKQDDTHKFPNKYINFDGFVNYIMFIPFDGRDLQRNFIEEGTMGDYLLFDRFRLLKFIADYRLVKNLSSFSQVVQKVIDFEEDIV